MPKIGKKKKLQIDLDYLFLFKLSQSILQTPNPHRIQEITNEYILQSEIVKSTRYASDRLEIPKTKEWMTTIFHSLRGSRFRQQLRVNQSTFEHLSSLLKGKLRHTSMHTCVDFIIFPL